MLGVKRNGVFVIFRTLGGSKRNNRCWKNSTQREFVKSLLLRFNMSIRGEEWYVLAIV